MTNKSFMKCTFTFTKSQSLLNRGTIPDFVRWTCDLDDLRVDLGREESLEPYGVIGDALWGEESELSPVEALDPLPLLLLGSEFDTGGLTTSFHRICGSGGGGCVEGGGWYALG